ncbi:putative mitochondrial hypothetical protein [Leptomonas pyrrhocoris]|uniref:Uncharacterized protein n=1 Tax=Leptomonas pyrrhocoris TaxID=157538 RepID=A0A0M9G7Y5_LEPPY|nr:putative mitochondrial hypothetical protein [Leptomonas pyrrhocoris]KPA84570.1 putative mitochondrial hypothetical protein [Leptomonas pyrrhocoris]|eukprot:XP_015663009.1 putative mitochondrial hypothetical protein [Leptomonas pyrrhocoris]
MSAFGVSSYFLWTQKGQTVLPLVRGSGFLMKFKQLNTFYSYHVISAAHVSCPVRYKPIYGDSIGLKAIGERHISTRLLLPDVTTHKVKESFDLEFSQRYMPSVDVASLRVKDEKQLKEWMTADDQGVRSALQAVEPDLEPIEEGTELVLCGVHTEEERANPNDDGLTLLPVRLAATCKAALLSLDYGTVLLASIDGPAETSPESSGSPSSSSPTRSQSPAVPPLPLSMCGGPVLRKSSGRCVGVLVARVMKSAPPRDVNAGALYQDPYLDISEHIALHEHWPLDVAFVPIGEFYDPLRRCEM